MREWLSGRASPCQGECREFESRLPLHFQAGWLECGCSSMVELQPSKLATWVRFPSPAPRRDGFRDHNLTRFIRVGFLIAPLSLPVPQKKHGIALVQKTIARPSLGFLYFACLPLFRGCAPSVRRTHGDHFWLDDSRRRVPKRLSYPEQDGIFAFLISPTCSVKRQRRAAFEKCALPAKKRCTS